MKQLYFFFISLILFSSLASALSVTGSALTVVDFYEPERSFAFEYTFGTTSATQDYKLRTHLVSGYDITEFIRLSDTEFKQVPPNSAIPFIVYFEYGDQTIPPGRHEAHVLVSETQAPGGTVGAVAEVGVRVIIISLYPTEYLKWTLTSTNANLGEPVTFKAKIRNWGEPDVAGGYAVYKIYDNKDNLVGEVTSLPFAVNSKESYELETDFDTEGLGVGDYKVIGKLHYAGEVIESQTKFRIGQKEIHIIKMTSSFVPEAINKVDVNVISGWNEHLDEVRGTVRVFDGSEEISDFRLLSISLDAWRPGKLEGYFDTTGIDIGNYTADVNVYFDGERTTEKFDIRVDDESQTETYTQVPGTIEFVNFQTVIIILLVIILGFNLYYILRKK